MIRVIVEDIAFGKTTIFPNAYNVDVVTTQHNDMLVITYQNTDGNDEITTYPMRHIYRYTVHPLHKKEDVEENDTEILE